MLDTRRRLTRFNSDPMHYADLPNTGFSFPSNSAMIQSPYDIGQPLNPDTVEDFSWTRHRSGTVNRCIGTDEPSLAHSTSSTHDSRSNRSFSIDTVDSLLEPPSLVTSNSYGLTNSSHKISDAARSWVQATGQYQQYPVAATPTPTKSTAPTFSKNPFRTPTQSDSHTTEAMWGSAARPRASRSQTTPGAYDRNPFQLHGHIKQTSQDLRHLQTQQGQRLAHRRGHTYGYAYSRRRDNRWSRPANIFKSFSDGDTRTITSQGMQSPQTPASASSHKTCPTTSSVTNAVAGISMSESNYFARPTVTRQSRRGSNTPDAWDWSTQYCLSQATHTPTKSNMDIDRGEPLDLSGSARNQWPMQPTTMYQSRHLAGSLANTFDSISAMQSPVPVDQGLGIDSCSDCSMSTVSTNIKMWQGLTGGSQTSTSMSSTFGLDSSDYFVTGANIDTSISAVSDMDWTGIFDQPQGQTGLPVMSTAGHSTPTYVSSGDQKRPPFNESSQGYGKRQRLA